MEEPLEILITTVAKAAEEGQSDEQFEYRAVNYKKLLDWEHFERLLTLSRNTGFYLKRLEINECDHLLLCYSNGIIKNPKGSERIEKNFLVNSFFQKFDGTEVEDLDLLTDQFKEGRELSLDEFYERLRVSHENDDLETGIPSEVQHSNLRPILRPYQKKGIKWMLKRELHNESFTSHNIKIRSKFNNAQVLYYNKYTQMILSKCPENLSIPSGGFLTDEMGLGKTVEIIGLMMMNPRRAGTKRKSEAIEDIPSIIEESFEKTRIKCLCHKSGFETSKSQTDKFIKCRHCSTSQHKACIFKREITNEDRQDYICPFCWKASGRLLEASTTIIVTPASIKSQWKDELQRHISDKSFKTLVYNGISNGWISPSELIKYDAVLTDFNTLSKELYFSDHLNDRSLRHGKKFEYPPSPLTSILWWRVVLDEAQMVENKNNRPSQMVKQLPAVHHWATTGTPIEKDSIRCLYGLVFFLNLEPFNDSAVFDQLWNGYRLGNHNEMIEVLSKVMWRTCKKNVENEINIPAQTEIVHQVEMTDLQGYFYRQVHLATKPRFMKNVEDYLIRNGTVYLVPRLKGTETVYAKERRVDLTMKDKFLYQLNNATLKIFLEPLRNLRQDCTIPSIFHSSNDQTRVKQTLKPEQLHEHLVSKTSIETKSALRSVCSSINGMAALKIAEEKYDEALTMYKQVLKLAGEYDTPTIHVDSMLQIHVYSSLMDIAELTGNEEELKKKDAYTKEMGRLEWKYITNYYDKVQEINEELKNHNVVLKKNEKKLGEHNGDWWRDIILLRRTAEEDGRLMDIINIEVMSAIANVPQVLEQTRTTQGIVLVIQEWFEKVVRYTKEVMKKFANLNYIVHNLRPSNEMTPEDHQKVLQIAEAALACHLNLFGEQMDEDDIAARMTRKKGFCELCKLKAKLNEYECLLFNKHIVDDITEGTWNPRFEEKLLKAILVYATRADFEHETIAMGKKFFKYFDNLKEQFKLLAKLWVEVNYTVSAYDELNMCKMRMQVVDSPEELTEEDVRYRLKILRYEVDVQMETFHGQKQEADVNFVRLNGRLKYLEHLKEKNEAPSCPICTNQPKERYYVTVCGHAVCAECFLMLVKNRNRNISCPVCRTTQETKNIYAVTCADAKGSAVSEPINGTFSPKIDEIVRCILRLKKEEEDVKILVFSHWDNLLVAIKTALEVNEINYRSSLNGNFNKEIIEFKDYSQDVTCMLLNLKFGGKGLNLIEATHVFLVEPILKADEEFQAIGRVHRIGQTRQTFVHRFITKSTIEETIYNKIISEKEKWTRKEFSIRDLEELFDVDPVRDGDDDDDVLMQ